jgi:hypothetical protein
MRDSNRKDQHGDKPTPLTVRLESWMVTENKRSCGYPRAGILLVYTLSIVFALHWRLAPAWLEVNSINHRSGLLRHDFIDQYERSEIPVILADIVSM